jgi:hypothetical protein
MLAKRVFQGLEEVFTKSFFQKIAFKRLDFQVFDLPTKIISFLSSK